jgi:tetratricopeptide (TPR) repeat protein
MRSRRSFTEQLLAAIEHALQAPAYDAPTWQARAWKLRGLCHEAIAEVSYALQAYERALALDPKVGVKRKVDQLRKLVK